MSKLANKIDAQQTRRVKLVPASPVVEVSENWTELRAMNSLAKEYSLGVTFVVKGFANDSATDGLIQLKDMARRQIIEEVFGEFRPLLRKVELALYNLNFDEARSALRELENEMMS